MNNTLHKKKQAGFTLLELLIIVSLSVMLMLSSSALFITFLLGNTKVNRMQSIKNEGEYAMAQMEFLLRNSLSLEPNNETFVCQADMESIAVKSIDGGVTTFFAEQDSDLQDKIASNSGIYLTSGDVTLLDGPTFDCSESADKSARYVTISFTLRKGTPTLDEAKDIIEQEFISGVALRN